MDEDVKTTGLVARRIKEFDHDPGRLAERKNMGMFANRPRSNAFQEYEFLTIFQMPVPFIYYAEKAKKIVFNDKAVKELMTINHTVNVVAIVGKYRTGKSLLLNRLAYPGKNKKAFGVGHCHNAMTKGVWIFCRPHPVKESQVLVLLDTEGLDDVMKSNTIEERWYFVLATLLSSTLVYNLKGTLDAGAIKKLKAGNRMARETLLLKQTYPDERNKQDSCTLSSLPVLNARPVWRLCAVIENIEKFRRNQPGLVIAVRDNYLKTTDEKGTAISPDQFLENRLRLTHGIPDLVLKFNEPRKLVRRYFKKRKCFMFRQPGKPLHLDDENCEENKIFEQDVDTFLEYIYDCEPKRMTSGRNINGRIKEEKECLLERGHLVEEIQKALNLQNAWQD